MAIANIIDTAVRFYSLTIFAYVMLSWLQNVSWANQLREMLAPVCEPYIGLFRRIVPPMGMMDFSPLVALLVLEYLLRPALLLLISALGL